MAAGPAGPWPFSFENVCYPVEMDPSWLRNSRRRWQAMKRAGQSCRALAQRSPVNHLALTEAVEIRRYRRSRVELSACLSIVSAAESQTGKERLKWNISLTFVVPIIKR
jgi:hypothetical protein